MACLAKRTRAPFHHAALATGVPPRLAPLEPAQPRLAAVLPSLVTRHTLHMHMHAPTPEPFGTHAHTSLGPTLTPYHLTTAGVRRRDHLVSTLPRAHTRPHLTADLAA